MVKVVNWAVRREYSLVGPRLLPCCIGGVGRLSRLAGRNQFLESIQVIEICPVQQIG